MKKMEIVKINVGGRRFEVSRSLLLETQPNSNLTNLILNNEKNEQDAADAIFIDRDGDIFQHVLQYLRNGKVSLPSAITIDSFITEMEYYKLKSERSNITNEEANQVSSSKPSKVSSLSTASPPKTTFVFGSNVPISSAHGSTTIPLFKFNTESSTAMKKSKDAMTSGFHKSVSTNTSNGGNSGGFSFGFNGASAQTPKSISTEMKEREASSKNGTSFIFGKSKQESLTKSAKDTFFNGQSAPFLKNSDYDKKALIKAKQSSQGNKTDTAQRLFEKVSSCFPGSDDKADKKDKDLTSHSTSEKNSTPVSTDHGPTSNEDEDKARVAFDSLDGSKLGKIKVSQLLFLFDDIGEDFQGDEYDKHLQILDPTRSGFIERSIFLDWYRQLTSQRVLELKDNPENEAEKNEDENEVEREKDEKKDDNGSTSHSVPEKISVTDHDNTNDIPTKSNEKDNRSEEIALLKKESEIAKKYQREGKYDEAVPIFRRCVLISEAILGPKHPDTLFCMNNLALVLEKKEEYGKAKHIYTKCLSKREEYLGPDHQDTLSSMSSLANLYRLQKKYDEAEKLYDLCLPKMKTILGPDHHFTLLTMHGLGALYFDKGENIKAEAYFVECLVRSEKTLGSDHPDTLMIVNTLGNFYLRQSDIVKARPLLLTAFSKRMTFLGSKHPDTMQAMSSLACLHSLEDEYEMAESLFNDCLSMNRENYGPKHLITLTSTFDLAEFYDSHGEYDKSVPLFDECLSERGKILGPDHPQTLNCMCSLASSYKSQRKFESESSLLRKVLSSRQKTLGSDHPDSVSSMAQLGISLLKAGKGQVETADEAIALLCDSLSKQKEILGPNHPDILELMHSLGGVYFWKYTISHPKVFEMKNKAGQIWEDCLSRRKKVLGPIHKSTLQTMDNLIKLYSGSTDKNNELEKLYRDCLATKIETLGSDDPDTLDTMFKLGLFLYQSKHAYDEALDLLHDCWLRRKKYFGDNTDRNSPAEQTRLTIQSIIRDLQRRGIQLSKDFPDCIVPTRGRRRNFLG